MNLGHIVDSISGYHVFWLLDSVNDDGSKQCNWNFDVLGSKHFVSWLCRKFLQMKRRKDQDL